jgi:hypothetical protein
MKLSDFILLSGDEKKVTVLHQGVLIGKRRNTSLVAFLFRVESFYVEACFNAKSRGIQEFRVFANSTLLEPYLDEIRIDDLLN